ncbi:MAG: fumarylacetoacetate hydrolase family protein [bacterium]|nr:fumarylacetoacetate hydrolase family protein [bacterium]
MKIVSFRTKDGAAHTGAQLSSNEILDFDAPAADLPSREHDLSWFDLGGKCLTSATELVAAVEADPARRETLRAAGAIVDSAPLLAPIGRPGKVLCIGLNYRDHAEESNMAIPEEPLVFSKFSNCVVGPGNDVVLPPGSNEVDYEAEFGIVIGRTATRVAESNALDHVLGYVCVNDVSARDFQFKDGQWQRGKSCDTFCPMGPFIATKDEIPAPETLPIRFRLNGETLQDSNTDQLIFNVAQLVSYVSGFVTLEPGDLISSGTPPGVGFARKPPVYIKAGDKMEVEIEGLGVLENPVVG